MLPIRTLLDQVKQPEQSALPPDLQRLYDGDLQFPQALKDRPYVIANFVSTLDGVVSYGTPGHAGGGEISGHDEADRFIMGLLRASADAVMIGSRTLEAAARDHVWIAEYIYPRAETPYRLYRKDVLGKAGHPRTIVVSASGRVDLDRAVFRKRDVHAHIITTPGGRERLCAAGVDRLPSTEVRVLSDSAAPVAPSAILSDLRTTLGVNLLLHEGGPSLFGQFVSARLVDEFFLTLAPQIAGRKTEQSRPAMVSGIEFSPETAPWLRILSVKQGGDHLYLRYTSAGESRISSFTRRARSR